MKRNGQIFRVNCKKGIKGLSRPPQSTDERSIRIESTGAFPKRPNREKLE